MKGEPIWSAGCRDWEPRLRAVLGFELLAAFGRAFLTRPPPAVVGDSGRLLNLGCGARPIPGWVNADFFQWAFWATRPDYWPVDLRRPLRCAEGHFEGVFAEHTLEHLCPADARGLLREMARVLRPGAWLRVVVPDLARYVAYYRGDRVAQEFAVRWPQRVDALRALTQAYGHRSVWDGGSACAALREAGFTEVREVGFREGSDPRLLVDWEERRWESLYVEGRRP